MLFKGNSSKLELLIGKIQANTLGTDPSLSWNSETADEDHSLSPSSCATPNSVVTEGNDPEVNFTIGPTESTPYACQFCEKAFPRLSYLKKHEQSHSDQMPFQCDFCQRLFKHKRSRDRHVKLHTGDKKYRCAHCESAFSRSDHLKIHMKTHDHQKPYQCVICNRGYNTAAALTSHMQNHKKEQSSVHSSPSPGPFRCLQCTGTFLTGEELQTHVSHHHRPISSSTPEKSLQSIHECGNHHNGNVKRQSDSMSPKTSPSSRSASRNRAPTATTLEIDHTTARLMLPYPMPKLTCIYCTKDSFNTMEALQLHVQAMHGALLNGDLGTSPHHLTSPMGSPPGVGSPDSIGSTAPGSLPCNFCTMKFSSLGSLHKHALSVHSLSGYLQAKAKENAFCAQCAEAFPNSIAYAEHFLIFHTNSNPHNIQQHHHPKHPQVCSPEPPQVNPTDLSKKNKGDRDGCASSSSTTSSGGQSPAKKLKRERDDDESRKGNNISGIPGNVGIIPALIPNPTLSFGPHSLLCNQCNAGFSDFESFRTHLKSHLEEIVHKFVCDECENEFGTEEQLESHALAHYLATTTEYGCQSCLKLFGKPDELQKHLMDIHAHHLYRCALCKEMFDSKVSIQVHFAVKHSNECKMFRCTKCTTIFRSEIEFQVHVKMAHLRKLSPYRCLLCSASFGNELDLQFHLSTHQKQFRCKFCDEAFHVEFLLDKHMQTHHMTLMNGDQSETTNITTGSSNNNNTNARSSGGKKVNGSTGGASNKSNKDNLKCDICDKTLLSEADLSNHRKQVHHITNSNSSTVSGSGSGVKGNQKSNHHNASGNNTLSLHCAYCNENCKSRSDLENHMKTHQIVSTGKHKCNICDEVCPTATLLAEHKLTHCKVVSGSFCTICKQNLYSEENFYSHMKQHCQSQNGGNSTTTTTTAQLPMPCIVCRQTLMTDIEIQMHAKFHTKQQQQQHFQNSENSTKSTSTTATRKNQIQCCLCHRVEDKVRFLLNGYTNGAQVQTYVCPDCCKKNSSAQKSLSTLSSPPLPPTSGNGNTKRNRGRSPDGDFRLKGGAQAHAQAQQGIKLENNGNPNKKSYQCIKCQMSFASEEEIQSHVTTHLMNEGSSHECHLCNHVFFDSPLKLQCHLIEHTFEGCSSFTCYMCSAVFTTATGLQQHMVEHGLHTRPYDCSHCHLKFFFRAELENHMVTHDEIKRSILERYAASASASTSASTDFTKCILNLTTEGGKNHNSNGHQRNQKRKKFFYRSDDSDEEMESHSQSGLSIKMETEESQSQPAESLEKRDSIRQRNGPSSVSDESMDMTPQHQDNKCKNNDQINGRTDNNLPNHLERERDSS